MRGFGKVRVVGIFVLLVFVTLFLVWYTSFASQQERYLTSRNFRVLTTLATQVDGTIANQQHVLRTLLERAAADAAGQQRTRRAGAGDGTGNEPPEWFRRARVEVPSLGCVDDRLIPRVGPSTTLTAVSRFEVEPSGTWLVLSFAPLNPNPPGSKPAQMPPATTVEIRIDAACLFTPTFEPKLRNDVFHTQVLATADGRMLYAIGDRATELKLTRFHMLERPPERWFSVGNDDEKIASAAEFSTLAARMSVRSVLLSGTQYKLFTHPCCQSTSATPPAGAPVRGAAGAPEMPVAQGLIVAGLVNADIFRSNTLEISPTVVVAGIAVLLLALAAWPFLKLGMMGERQRARRRDVLAVAACGIFGLALLTIGLLDAYAYTRLNRARDWQLERLAALISDHLQRELRAAYAQLACFERASRGIRSVTPQIFKNAPVLGLRAESPECAWSHPPYPVFQTFSTIDQAGTQVVKWGPYAWVPAPISVKSREYFNEVQQGRVWTDVPACKPREGTPPGCVIESIWSLTTGRQEAVLSKPTGSDNYPVAALAIPMLSLIRPVLVEGFEFAVIDETGRVLFHSDPQRNLHENLVEETDRSRRLRAAIAAHSRETLNVRYWGSSYRAHVNRVGVRDWSVVTLYNKQPAWALHIEWLVVTLTFLAAYTLAWTGLVALCLATRTAAWLWPDPRRRWRYWLLAAIAGLLLAAGARTLGSGTGGLVLMFVIPLVGWISTYLVLAAPPSKSRSRRDPRAAYTTAALLLLLLTSVLPAAGFFAVAYGMHVRTYVKYGQLKFAQSLAERAARFSREYAATPGVDGPWMNWRAGHFDIYQTFFFDTRFVEVATDLKPARSAIPVSDEHSDDLVTLFLEEYLPYYSERSVQMRELLHDRADDGAWEWSGEGNRLQLQLSNYRPDQTLQVHSLIPLLLDPGPAYGPALSVPLLLAGVALLGLAWAIILFVERHVYLVGLDPPLWSSGHLASNSGENLFIVCDEADRQRLAEGTSVIELKPIADAPSADLEWMRKLMEIDRADAGRPILFADFDQHLDDLDFTQKKLRWIEALVKDETRTVVVLSWATPSRLDYALRIAISNRPRSGRLLQLWSSVLSSFVVINWRGRQETPADTAPSLAEGVRELRQDVQAAWRWLLSDASREWLKAAWQGVKQGKVWTRRIGALTPERPDLAVLRSEAQADAFVRRVCTTIEQSIVSRQVRLTPEQVLDEVAERSAVWYHHLWKSCREDEQAALAEIARDGFVNYKRRRAVRRLLARRLIDKNPNLRLMNETFRRFVLSGTCQADIRAQDEVHRDDPSPWNEFRGPFFVTIVGAAAFFMITQRELFNATIAGLTTLTMAVPVLLRALGFLTGRRVDETAGNTKA